MPRFRVKGSNHGASYASNSLVLIHKNILYDLEVPLIKGEGCDLFVDEHGKLCMRSKDGICRELPCKSDEEVAKYHDAHRRKLRVLRQAHAKRSLKFVVEIQTAVLEAQKRIQAAVKGLTEEQQRLDADAADIAGAYYNFFHTVPFQLGDMSAGSLMTSDFVSVLQKANGAVCSLEPIATAVDPPLLPNEIEEPHSIAAAAVQPPPNETGGLNSDDE
jgi:hypothetical protein